MASNINRKQADSSDCPGNGPRGVSCQSDVSFGLLIDFKKKHDLAERPEEVQRRANYDGVEVSCVSQRSKSKSINFKEGTADGCVKVGRGLGAHSEDFGSESHQISKRTFSGERPDASSIQHQQHPGWTRTHTFKLLEEHISIFMKMELERFQKLLNEDFEELRKTTEVVEDEKMKSNREAFQKITFNFLKTMKQEQLADCLERKTSSPSQANLKKSLKAGFQNVFEGIAEQGKTTPLQSVFTDLCISTGGGVEVNDQSQWPFPKAGRAETAITCENFFKVCGEREDAVRTVITKGVAGIGKTLLVQKFTLDWAEDKTNQNVHFVFPFKFRDLNVLKEKKCSLVDLINYFYREIKEAEICRFEEDSRVVFVLDGLDECRLRLDFNNTEILTKVTAAAPVEVLLTNLMRGKLLPSARLWITTRPTAANQIPPECVDMVTEVRGFSDAQKEEYFRKKFKDERQFSRIMSHIETSRSLHIMCHIPVFCWITATVLDHILNSAEGGELPNTLTEMYIYFLVFQAKAKKKKYDRVAEADPLWSPDSRKLVESLGRLAYEQLEKEKFSFCESDLNECGLDIRVASVCSGVLTQTSDRDSGPFQSSSFCFVHLSVQEFLAALHVHMTFTKSSVNLLEKQPNATDEDETEEDPSAETRLYRRAVDKALQSPCGHLDLFLRFLLGLSLPCNRRYFKGLLMDKEGSPQTNQETVQYIKKKIDENPPPEKCINLFHCLNELNDHSLEQMIQWYLRSGRFSTTKPSSAMWEALIFILLSSGKDLEVFDLKKYSASEEAFLRLLPVVKASNKALLGGCNLTERSCEALSSLLSSPSCCLRGLDLSNNDLGDSGVRLLSVGLQSPHCKLETLRLSGCMVTDEGCRLLTSALTANPSHLKELGLTYNHLSGEAVDLISALKHGPHARLDTLGLYPTGPKWLLPGLKKYACNVVLDPNTANKFLYLYDKNTKIITTNTARSCSDHPDRYETWAQVSSGTGLRDCCYWEVEWEKEAHIAVTYKPEGDDDDSCLGLNKYSWSLSCHPNVYYARHDTSEAIICPPTSSSSTNRVGVYLDWQAGNLSFYSISSEAPVHLYTFYNRFTDSVYPAFGFWGGPGAAVSLCQL